MYVLKAINGSGVLYVKSGAHFGFTRTYDIDTARTFVTISELLKFVSTYGPGSHPCGDYNIVRIKERHEPRYVEAGVVG